MYVLILLTVHSRLYVTIYNSICTKKSQCSSLASYKQSVQVDGYIFQHCRGRIQYCFVVKLDNTVTKDMPAQWFSVFRPRTAPLVPWNCLSGTKPSVILCEVCLQQSSRRCESVCPGPDSCSVSQHQKCPYGDWLCGVIENLCRSTRKCLRSCKSQTHVNETDSWQVP